MECIDKLINKIILRQRQLRCRRGLTKSTIRFDPLRKKKKVSNRAAFPGFYITHITFRIDFDLGHGVVILHILFADISTVLDRFNPFFQAVRRDNA